MRRVLLAATILSVVSFFGCGGGSSAPPAIAVAVSPSSTQTVDQGQSKAFTATVSNDSTNAGVTWSVAGTGCTGNACGTLGSASTTGVTYTAPSPVSANLSVTLTATSVTDATKSATVGITVVPAPAVTTASLASGTVGVAYSATLQASGGVAPLTWSIASGSLPAGVTLNASTGVISGTPTTAGTANFTVQVADSGSPALTAQAALSITIAPPPLSITTTTLANGAVNESYSATVAATGGTPSYSWSATGLPTGLSINAGTGAITGTPSASGSFTVNVTVTDSTMPTAMTTSKQFTVTINAALAISTSSLAGGTVNTAYSQSLAATGGTTPYTWSISAGSLPAGLSLSSAGTISGTPTVIGTSTFTVQVADAGGASITAVLSIVIAPAPLAITTTSLPNGAVNETYNATLASSGGTPPVTWAVTLGTLPAGLALNASTGAITGTPTTPASSTFTITATDSTTPTAMTASKQFTVVINAALAITTSSLANGTVGTSYSTTVVATGGTTPYSWSISSGALPGGLSLNSSTGTISGTPTTSGSFTFTVDVTDAGSVTVGASLGITVNVVPLVITSSTLPSGVQGSSYSATISTSGGTPPVTFAVTTGTPNAGLTLNASTGVISGTPTATGSSTFTITATDSTTPTAQTTTATYTLTVTAANNGELNGQYAFVVGGFDGSGYANSAGSITADGNGNITSGVVDNNNSSGVATSLAVTGTYSIGSDNRGTMTITTSAGTSTMAFVVGGISSGVATKGHVINYDPNSWVTGQFKKQDPTAFTASGVNGNFAMGAVGGDSLGQRFAIAGRMTLSSGTISNGIGDDDTAGTLQSSILISGSYTTPDTRGRSTANLTFNGAATPVHQAIYVVSASEFYIVSLDPMTTDQSYSGVALAQSGTFNNGSLNGTSVFYQQGNCNGGTHVGAGLVVTNGSGTISVSDDENKCGVVTSNNTFSGTYSVASNGRVMITGSGNQPILYLVSAGKGFLVGTNTGVDFGQFEAQSGGPFSASTVAGTFMFGSLWPAATGVGVQSGTATFTSLGAITGTSDQNQSGATSTGAINDTFSISSNGRATSGKGDELWYFISPSKAVMIDVKATNTNPGATIIDK